MIKVTDIIHKLVSGLYPTGRAWRYGRDFKNIGATDITGYGYLYNWYAMTDDNFSTIENFRIPNDDDWNGLFTHLDPNGGVKASGIFELWDDDVRRNSEYFGQSGLDLVAGCRRTSAGTFDGTLGEFAAYGSSTEGATPSLCTYWLLYASGTIYQDVTGGLKKQGSSVRLVADGDYTSQILEDYDGNRYGSVYINGQTWLTENYRCTHLSDGTSIPNVTDGTAWGALTTLAYCAFDNEENNVTRESLNNVSLSDKTMSAKTQGYDDINTSIGNVLNQIIPDNDAFDLDDIESWERVLDIDNSTLTNDQRKNIILARLSYPNGQLYRQTQEFIQEQLRANGFDVYVHENRFNTGTNPFPFEPVDINSAVYGNVVYGETTYGNVGVKYDTLLCNYVDKTIDEANQPIISDKQNNIFFIGGEVYPEQAYIDPAREKEFRHLVLSLKPAHSAAALITGSSNVDRGYLYNWYASQLVGFSTITDFDVPTDTEWAALESYINNAFIDGKILKATYGWPTNQGIDLHGFAALPNGLRSGTGVFTSVSDNCRVMLLDNATSAYKGVYMSDADGIINTNPFPNSIGYSIRMIYKGGGTPDSVVYDKDGNAYDVVQIGSQYWLAQNYACTQLSDGTEIPNITDDTDWGNDTSGARCASNNDESTVFK